MKISRAEIIILIVSVVIFSSCSDSNKVKKIMSEFIETEIVIPDDLHYIYNRNIIQINKDNLKPNKFIIYYDSLECYSCKISHLMEICPLYEMGDTCNFSVIIIFDPISEDFENIRQQVLIANYPFPVYIDKNSSFKSNNKTLPKDARFHYFLINSRNLPIFVGNPLSNQQLNELFINVLNVINN